MKEKVLNREFHLDESFKKIVYYKIGGLNKSESIDRNWRKPHKLQSDEPQYYGHLEYSYQVIADGNECRIVINAVIHKNKWYLMDLFVYKTPHRFIPLLLSKGELILHDKYDTLEGSKNYIIDCPL
ncbi:hypothetical protein EI427_25060 [Flammeovirga pectinis]|uniref:Uncharacterized protein n=1 Tax=Flammeovirga pectinis TaxID=2494373 RepID=A0A3S9PB64_9BACT|nr:hypothetical protein EI427_25060 [Flammeovirga pectinis]